MVIAVNTRFLTKGRLEGYGYFIQETVQRLAANIPSTAFIFSSTGRLMPGFSFPANVTPLVVGPPARHPVLWKWWYDVKLPPVLKKIRADVFLSPDGFCSLTTRVPQCLVVHDLGFCIMRKGIKKATCFITSGTRRGF
jgi:hypothetical protein